MSEEINAVQENTTVEQDDSAVDYKNLYLNEVQNAKKLRKRAQDSEGSLQEIQKQRETERVILALESVTTDETLEPIDYTRAQIDEALETELDQTNRHLAYWSNRALSAEKRCEAANRILSAPDRQIKNFLLFESDREG